LNKTKTAKTKTKKILGDLLWDEGRGEGSPIADG